MRGLLAATAVLGVVVIGGLPVLALTLADSETGDSETTTLVGADRRPGPPPWALGHGRAGKPDHARGQDDDEAREDEDRDADGQPGWARRGDAVPPGWAKHRPGATPHGWAMRTWAHCVADAAAKLDEGERLDPEAACGNRPKPPVAPGQAR